MKPKICPVCGSDEIGELDSILELPYTDEEYERAGGRYYCVACGWGQEIDLLKKLTEIIDQIEQDIEEYGYYILGTSIGAGYLLQELKGLQNLRTKKNEVQLEAA